MTCLWAGFTSTVTRRPWMMMVLLGRCGTSLVPGRSQLSSQSDDKWTRSDGTNVDKDSSHLAALKVPWRRYALAWFGLGWLGLWLGSRLEARLPFLSAKLPLWLVARRFARCSIRLINWPKQSLPGAAGRSRDACPRACCIDLSVKLMSTFIINLQIDNEHSHLMCRTGVACQTNAKLKFLRLSLDTSSLPPPCIAPRIAGPLRCSELENYLVIMSILTRAWTRASTRRANGQEVAQTHFKI